MQRFLEVSCLVLAAQGIGWAIAGGFDPWGVWERLAAEALYGASHVPDEARPFARLLFVLLGGTDAGFFVMAWALARHGVRRGQRWAFRALAGGLLTWFVVDSSGSLALGAWFNVVLVNVPALAVVLVPLAWLGRDAGEV